MKVKPKKMNQIYFSWTLFIFCSNNCDYKTCYNNVIFVYICLTYKDIKSKKYTNKSFQNMPSLKFWHVEIFLWQKTFSHITFVFFWNELCLLHVNILLLIYNRNILYPCQYINFKTNIWWKIENKFWEKQFHTFS